MKLYTIWVAYDTVGCPIVVPVNVRETARQIRVLTNSYAVRFRTFLYSDNPELKHRTPESAIKYWHKQNALRIAELKRELLELECLDCIDPIIDRTVRT